MTQRVKKYLPLSDYQDKEGWALLNHMGKSDVLQAVEEFVTDFPVGSSFYVPIHWESTIVIQYEKNQRRELTPEQSVLEEWGSIPVKDAEFLEEEAIYHLEKWWDAERLIMDSEERAGKEELDFWERVINDRERYHED